VDQYSRMRRLAVVRAVMGMLVLAVALGLAGVAVTIGTHRFGLTGTAAKAVPAATLFLIAVPLIILLRRCLDRQPFAGLALRLPREALTGFAIVTGAALVTFGVDAAAGGIRLLSVDGKRLITFLVVNSLLALALEAIPEELSLRGYAYRALADRWRSWAAAAGTTALFVVAPALGIAMTAGIGRLIGLPTPSWTFAPSGQDPVTYGVLIATFGAMLVTARVTTQSLWACIAAHLTFLTINRIIVMPARDTGVVVEPPLGGEVLVLVYLLVATGGFLLLARLRRTHRHGQRRPELLADAAHQP
jgi:membrane protease YdiL (CAAX protease family)